MRLPRVRITIRRMMIVVLVVGSACGWFARRFHRPDPLEEAYAQHSVTWYIMCREAGPFSPTGRFRELSGEVIPKPLHESPIGRRLSWKFAAWCNPEDTGLADVEVSWNCDGVYLSPITIKVNGGPWDTRVAQALARGYRERGWQYVIIPRAGGGADTRRIGTNLILVAAIAGSVFLWLACRTFLIKMRRSSGTTDDPWIRLHSTVESKGGNS